MNEQALAPSAPSSILLATDLSCRCDRALDRAVLAARRWKARLVVLTVIDPTTASAARQRRNDVPSWWERPNLQAVTERCLRASLPSDIATTVRVGEGAVADTILEVAAAEGCGLIVTGIARDETFGRMILGTTVDGLVRRAATPILVVRTRPLAPYRRVTVATDFSPPSCQALRAAASLFPEADLSVFHAFDAPYAGLIADDGSGLVETHRAAALRDAEAFLASCPLPPDVGGRVRAIVEHGAPAPLIDRYVSDADVDLVVVGSHGRGMLLQIVLGSVAQRILQETQVDVLIVREPRAPAA